MIRPLRRRPFRSLLLSLPLALLLAACEQGAAPGGPEAETVSVTLAPSLSPHGLATQGISGDLVISDVLVQVRDARGDLGPVFWFDPDGNVVSEGSSEGSTELSIWDGTGVVPTTLQLPVRDDTGADIPYDFLLNVRSQGTPISPTGSPSIEVTTAFASASVPLLQDGTTITFADLTSFLGDALLYPVDPLSADSDCPLVDAFVGPNEQFPPETFEVEPGDLVSLFLAPIAPGTGAPKCLPGDSSDLPFTPFPDFGVGAASVLLDGVDDITAEALPFNASKRGMLVQVPDDALSGETIEVSLTASGTGSGAGGTTTDGFVTATAPVVETATVSLQVVESPVELPVGAGGLDVDLTAPEILSHNFNTAVTQADFRVGPSDDAADVDSVVGFVGPRPLLLEFAQFIPTALEGITWRALVCNDFSAIAPIPGDVTTLDATFYAIDPDGNQSEPYAAPITLNSSYPGPSGSCSTTVTW
jgi:hypothetical protein